MPAMIHQDAAASDRRLAHIDGERVVLELPRLRFDLMQHQTARLRLHGGLRGLRRMTESHGDIVIAFLDIERKDRRVRRGSRDDRVVAERRPDYFR